MVIPKFEKPARRANTLASTPLGQTLDMRMWVGIALIMKRVFWTEALPSMKTQSGSPRSRFQRWYWATSRMLVKQMMT
jgi:hypothetical protein